MSECMSDFSEAGKSVSIVSHACHAKATSNAHCPTPATQKRRSPEGRQGVHPTPWQCTLHHACHTKEAEPEGRQGVHPTPWQCTLHHACHAKEAEPEGRQGVHPTPWQCTLSHACHEKEAEPEGRHRAYIRPLGSAH